MKKKWIFLLLIVGLVGGVIWWRSSLGRKSPETAVVERGIVKEELILSGEMKAEKHTELHFSTSGEVTWIGATEGQWVKKGQRLAQLDAKNLNSTLEMAKADLRSAEAKLARVLDDVHGHDSDETFTQRETRTAAEVVKDKAYEAVLQAEKNLNGATLVAPFDGMVTSVVIPFSGINVLYSQPMIEVMNPETMYFEVSADQTEVTDLTLGQAVTIVMDSFADESFEGEVSYLGYTPKAGETGTSYLVKVKLQNVDTVAHKFRVGMTGDAKFLLSQKDNVLYLPPRFINSDGEGTYVKLEAENNKHYVETGIEGEDRVEVIGNLSEGEIVYD
ncbi:MAG TPA: efflux RND transporter periplasmic adaptor subunit [Patescibacteria group bacterium]|nr:efflux RND transporter periplasmic adaptor subunit [Patescibacteria group bacterium]